MLFWSVTKINAQVLKTAPARNEIDIELGKAMNRPIPERRIRIVATGSYVPRTAVYSSQIDDKLNKRKGWTKRLFQIDKRHFAEADETTSYMAARAAQVALQRAGMTAGDLDCIVAACGVGEQPIPSTAVLVQNKLGLGKSGIAAFDVNSTCLSFVTAFELVADAIAMGRFRRALIVSSDIASCGLDWSNPEAAAIFGDGAAAVIVQRPDGDDGGRLLASGMATYGSFQDVCRLEAGGTRVVPNREEDGFWSRTRFIMDGPAALTCVLTYLPGFLEQLTRKAAIATKDLDLLILHQASSFSLNAVQKHLGFASEKMIRIFADYGNQIAASIPHTLDRAITSDRIRRGDRIMLLGTSAGISFGGLIVEY
jgi:3-oxoacyl-[acyl-carrier-protein] synthase III